MKYQYRGWCGLLFQGICRSSPWLDCVNADDVEVIINRVVRGPSD